MNIRSRTYLLLIPSTLSLGVLYLIVLLGFSQRDAYLSLKEQIQDRANIIGEFINSTHPESTDDILKYLDEALLDHQSDLTKNNISLMIRIRDSVTHKTLYNWPRKKTSSDLETINQSDISSKNYHIESRRLELPSLETTLILEVLDSPPIKIYFDKSFWTRILVLLVLLFALGVFLSEILLRIILRDVRNLGKTIKPSDGQHSSNRSSHRASIQELEELSNAYDTLYDTYDSKITEDKYLKTQPLSILKQQDYQNWARNDERILSNISIGGLKCHLFHNPEKSTQHISFFYKQQSAAYCFVGFLKTSSNRFETNVAESIVADLFDHLSSSDSWNTCHKQLQQLNLFNKIILFDIFPEKLLLRQSIITNGSVDIEKRSIAPMQKSVFPVGFEIPKNIENKIVHSEQSSSLLIKLFATAPGKVMLFIEPNQIE